MCEKIIGRKTKINQCICGKDISFNFQKIENGVDRNVYICVNCKRRYQKVTEHIYEEID